MLSGTLVHQHFLTGSNQWVVECRRGLKDDEQSEFAVLMTLLQSTDVNSLAEDYLYVIVQRKKFLLRVSTINRRVCSSIIIFIH